MTWSTYSITRAYKCPTQMPDLLSVSAKPCPSGLLLLLCRFSNLMCALAAAYRDEPLPPMLHDRSAIQPANLARAAREVLGLEVPLEEQGVTSSSGSAVTGPADSNVQPGPSAPEAQPAAAAPPPPPPQLPVMEPSECAFAAIHIPLREINTLKAEAAAFAEAHGLDAVALSANDVVTGLFAVARATLSGQPLPGTKLSQAKGSGEHTGLAGWLAGRQVLTSCTSVECRGGCRHLG
jgi:hypothetical protein